MNTTPLPKIMHYNDHLRSLQLACDWIGLRRGRAVKYTALLREFFEEGKRSRDHILAYNESCEIADLHVLWASSVNNYPKLMNKIQTVFRKGPNLREDENPGESTNKSRNDAWAYLLAGKLIRSGLQVVAVDGAVAEGTSCYTMADINLEWNGSLVNIECKRPQTQESLANLVEKARRQLTDPSRKGWPGIFAIDCSAFIRPLGQLLEADSAEEAKKFVADLLGKTVVPKVNIQYEPTILGCILFARTAAMTRAGVSQIVSPQGNPVAYYFRPDSIASWTVVNNSESLDPMVLRCVFQRLSQSMYNG